LKRTQPYIHPDLVNGGETPLLSNSSIISSERNLTPMSKRGGKREKDHTLVRAWSEVGFQANGLNGALIL
jgi:hypothetical protein